MIEMHKLTRYEYAPVLKFDPDFDAEGDAARLAAWLDTFSREKGRPPKHLSFTFHADNSDADHVCRFMKSCAGRPEVANVMSQTTIELVFVGTISDAVAAATRDRILTQTF